MLSAENFTQSAKHLSLTLQMQVLSMILVTKKSEYSPFM